MGAVYRLYDNHSAILFDGVNIEFEGRRVISSATFCVPSGSVVAVLGEGGSGKSSLLRLINGELSASAGTIELYGYDIEHPDRHRLVAAGWLSPKHAEHCTVGEALASAARMWPDARNTHEVMHSLALEGLEDRLWNTLSAGESKRASIALALSANPHILLLDDPFVGLDERSRGAVATAIRHFAACGGTVLFSTCNPSEASSLAASVLHVHGGSAELLRPEELMASEAFVATIRFTASHHHKAELLQHLSYMQSIRVDGCRVEITTDQPEEMLRWILLLDAGAANVELGRTLAYTARNSQPVVSVAEHAG